MGQEISQLGCQVGKELNGDGLGDNSDVVNQFKVFLKVNEDEGSGSFLVSRF